MRPGTFLQNVRQRNDVAQRIRKVKLHPSRFFESAGLADLKYRVLVPKYLSVNFVTREPGEAISHFRS